MTSLLTTSEAVTYGNGSAHLAPDRVTAQIPVQEERLFNERFGWDFYDRLQADRITYGLRAAGQAPIIAPTVRTFFYHDPVRTDFVFGDYVLARDQVFEVLRPVDVVGIEVSNTDYYRLAPKFHTACYQALWERYLRGILAVAVTRAAIVPSTFQVTSRGGVKQYEEGKSKSLTVGEVAVLKADYQAQIEDTIDNTERFIRRDTGNYYALYGRLTGTGSPACGDEGLITSTRSSAAARRRKNFGFSL